LRFLYDYVHKATLRAIFPVKNTAGIIGPATVGGIKPGCLRIGNTGGMSTTQLEEAR